MSEPTPPPAPPPAPPPDEPLEGSVSGLQAFYERAGGVAVPVAATLLAFLIGGLVVAVTEKSLTAPFEAYKAIFEGTGLTWFIPGGDTAEEARDLQQTLLIMTPLVLTGLAVAFAFRCGMFNIGGQGQYWVGLLTAIWFGTHFDGAPPVVHVTLTIVAGIVAGAVWGGIAGLLKATTGAHEVISTIMLNWIAIWVGKWLLEAPDGFLQGSDPSLPRSDNVLDSAKLPTIWGALQPLHAGIFISLFALIVYHLLLNRTTLGFQVRAVGFNPEAAALRRHLGEAQLLPRPGHRGLLRGARGRDRHGSAGSTASRARSSTRTSTGSSASPWRSSDGTRRSASSSPRSCSPRSQVGTSPRQLDPEIFNPELATNLAIMIQALIIAFVGAEFLIIYLWRARRKVGFGPRRTEPEKA